MYHHEAAAAGPAATQQQYAVAIMEPYPQPLSRHASSKHSRASSSRSTNNGRGSALAHSQITPPPTPNASQETLVEPVVEQQQQQQQELELELQQQQHQQQLQPAPSPSPPPPPPHPYFHPFLRAFYPFSPTDDISSSTVTLPLREGDVILVHSIHTNGWADGTLLYTGERGWLPTNYCEAYEHEPIRNLLMALLNFWDLLRGGFDTSLAVFTNQEYIRGIIAG
ncbi:MAG: hypothetical protein M1829_002904, partial [Trizodia sp. TS-e1964]